MLISHRKKFIFTKTTKTASTSVEHLFEPFCIPDNEQELLYSGKEHVSDAGIVGARGKMVKSSTWYNHMTINEIYDLMDKQTFESYFKFTTVRNPYSKAVSYFYYLEKRIQKLRQNGLIVQPEKFNINESINNDVLRFRDWLKSGTIYLDSAKYFLNGQVAVNYFIRFENLFKDLHWVLENLDIPTKILNNLKHKKIGVNKKPISTNQFYDQASRKIIEDKFEWELNYFSYDLP